MPALDPRQTAHPVNHSNPKPGDPCHPLRGAANAEPAIIAFDTTQITHPENRSRPDDRSPQLSESGHPPAIAFDCKAGGDTTFAVGEEVAGALRGEGHGGGHAAVMTGAIPIHSDAARSSSSALTPSPDAEGRVRLRDPGIGIGAEGDAMFSLTATQPHAVAFQTRVARNGRGGCEEIVPALSGDDAGATSDMRPCFALLTGSSEHADAD